ncbi:serine-rich adhesin for platelets [Musca vetustissima]|uniref:serine-rich adhesin for platelets n=1 Tax=Musca vetustissima TaxID=27455 RepID=UPI002AB7BDC4|nr:serine-rich adhesin for platelets [Musca vetustissima]
MSKLSFRARALDPSKQMPIYLAEELPDLPEYSAINRAVPQMPSGMEKEEESEHHLQRAICTGLIIPTPEVYTTDQDFYDKNYPPNYRMPRQLIHMQPLGLEQDVPEYDMDSEDEVWVTQQRKRLDLTPFKFEQMMDRLEKSSGQTVVTLNEAKALLKQDDEVSIAVYDYWLNKRLKMQHPLILSVKTENRPGASSNNPYLAFRRRTEKMQTRKNRKNDETSYEKMLKLRRDLQRATTVLEMVKRREKTKREHVHLSIEIFEKRVQLKDFNGALLSELSATIKNSRPAFAPLYANQYSHHSSSSGATPTAVVPSVSSSAAGLNNVMGSSTGLMTAGQTGNVTTSGSSHMYSSAPQYLNSANVAMDALNAGSRKEKRQYKKRKHKIPRDKQQLNHQQQQQQQQYLATMGVIPTSGTTGAALGAGGGVAGIPGSTSGLPHHLPHHMHHHLHRQSSSPAPNESNIETEEEDLAHKIGSESEEEAPFAFRRKQGCDYLRSRAHTGNWPWEPKEEYGFGDTKYRYTLASIKHPRPRCIGFARRRMGRGGRILLDRVASNFDDFWSQLDYTILESKTSDCTTASVDTTAATTTTKTNNKKDSSTKPASPPTVVDLVPPTGVLAATASTTNTNVNNANTPATLIKQEIMDTNNHLLHHLDPAKTSSSLTTTNGRRLAKSDDGVEDGNDDDTDIGLNGDCCEYEYSDDELEDEHGLHIQRDRLYHSCISMARRRRRRRRQQQQQQQNEQNSKRRKLNNAHLQQKNMEAAQRRLLYKLSQSLMMDNGVVGSVNGRVNNLVNSSTNVAATAPAAANEAITHDKVNGLNKTVDENGSTTTTWPNHRCASSAANATVLDKLQHTSSNSISTSTTSSSLLAWSSPSTTTTNNNNSSSLVIGISNNHNNNNSSNNVNMNISSNGSRSNSCSISDKTNVIKREIIIQDADSENASTSSCNPGDLLATSRAIKQEMMDSSAPSLASADDSNEPLSSIQKLNAGSVVAAAADIVEDEENLNLAQLSNLIKIKKEEEDVIFEYSNDRAEMFGRNGGAGGPPLASESEDDEVSCFNQMADVIRQRDLSRRSRRSLRPNSSGQPLKGVNVLIEEVATINEQKREQSPEDEVTMLGGLSPTSSQRLDICNELLSEIRRDWLHFRPKTPTETEKEDFWSLDMDYKLTSPLVDWSQQTPIAVEMVRESLSPIRDLKKASKLVKQESSLWKDNDEFESSAFITPAFKYEDLEADTQLLQSSFMSDITRGSSKSPEAANNSACLDLNFSGDSLNDINLLGDGDDADMLDNILQEVQIDDIKTLATNFWNGILDGENVDTEVDGDVEAAAGLLEGIDDATKKCDKSVGGDNKKNTRGKGGKKACAALTPVGSSSFNCSPLEEAIVKDETFFKLEEPKKEPCDEEGETSSAVPEEEVAVKSEPMDVSETKVGCLVPVVQPTVVPNNMIVRLTPQQRQITASTPALVMASSSVDSSNCSSINTQQDVVQHAGTPIVIAQPMIQPQQQQQQQHHQSSQQPPHLITHSTPLQVIGNTITLNPGDTITTTPHNQMQATSTNSSATVTQMQQQHQQQPSPSQQQQQHQLTTIQVVQQPQGTTQQIRNVTVQQLHQIQLQQQQQRKLQLQQQQQQQKLLMQQRAGELVNAAAAASSSNNSSAGGGASVIAQYIPNTTSNSNTTTTTIMRQPTLTPIGAATITHNNNSTTGQMIYTTTSAGEVIGTTTGSQKIYLQKAPVSLGSSSGQGVNIINTSSGQQLTVQNIAGVQHINATGNGSNATAGPLIVTTSARNAVQQLTQQQQQQMVGQQPTQQIVWRQIGSTNVTTTPAGVLAGAATTAVTNADGTVTATMGAGNKIVWTNRPAQKRQLNGPESTDINKVLLNRKFSQRKIITQAHQQILQQQHLQQQQQQQSQDDDLTTTLNALSGQETTTTTGVTYTTQQQQQQQQQHQIQKVTTTGGGGSGGKVIKMPSSFPLLVSEVNLQQQQKHNTAAAIAANHNYSLQPTAAIITSQASQQQGGGSSSSGGGNKIYLTASSSGGAATNYTITNASELQSAAQKLQASNSNLKLNFVATTSNANNSSNNSQVVTGGGINVQPQQQQQTLVLNKATVQQQQLLSQQLLQQQGKLKRERILNIIGAATSVDGSNANATTAGTITATSGTGGVSVTGDNNNKRVLYTSLVNVKQLQKNNTGQMQVQIGGHQAMAHAVLRNRIGNNQIFANMRTVPVATVVASAAASNHNNNVTVASSAGGGGGTTVQVVSSNQQTAAGNLNSNTISVSTNSLSSNEQQHQQQQQVVNDGSGLTIINSTSDLKSVTVTASSANSGGGGLIENTNNNSSPVTTNNSNNSNNSSSSNGGGNSNSNNNNNVTTTNNTTTINRDGDVVGGSTSSSNSFVA